ncbi:MAG: hypothetical protein KGI29_08165, partial [Pseudomonadota bacterium]|nr:hypothetical protein [Pseudomonadota bacterium]
FRQRNGRLPCPADGTLAVNTQYFGVETIPAGDCTNGSSYTSGNSPSNTQSADFYDGINTTAGIVPVKTLGLPDAAAFDPWGGAFFYAVDKRITGINAFAAYLVTDTGIGSITVNDGAGNARVTQAIALVMSFGEDGHGAYQFGGGRKSSGSTNLNEQTNCHCNSSATAQTFNATFVQQTAATTNNADPLNIFDDVLRYYVRSSFLSATDISPR